MSSPYSTQTISGYNSSPPADDGSQVASNEIAWSKHKTKLGDPIKTLAEAINTEALSAFGLTFGQGISAKSADYTVVAGDRGNFFSVTGTTTITLLPVATAGDGFPIAIINTGTGVVTVDGDGSETINGSTDITLNPNDSIILNCNSTIWVGPTISGNNKPSFSVHRNNINQNNITSIDKIEWTTEEFDTNSDFDVTTNYRFTPTVAGKYQMSVMIQWSPSGASDVLLIYIYKNGASYKTSRIQVASTGLVSMPLSTVVDANGTTDYFEIFAQNVTNDTSDIQGAAVDSYWTGCKID